MDEQEAARMTLALDEILTNIYLFGYREESGEMPFEIEDKARLVETSYL